MLELQNVIKSYNTKAGTVRALNGVSLTFPNTGLVFITGKSGCGKTTMLNVIGGLDGIDDGEIFVQNKRFSAFSTAEYDSYRNTFIGFIFQEYNLLPEFTVEKNIKMAMELQGRQTDEKEFDALLQDVGIVELKDRFPSELSGGQRQRVAIARALVKQPRIIMADEPTGALDSDTGEQVLDTLKRLSKKTLVIVVSHDREFAEKYADRIIHLVDGQIAQDVSFTEKEIRANVNEQEKTLAIRQGAELSEEEKNVIAKAVKARKSIEVVENLSFRDKSPTKKIERQEETPVVFRKSQMKTHSAMFLGLKSLLVKPVRLFITILISALAFAVFGVFDTLANFTTASVLKKQLTSFSETVVVTPNYVRDYDDGDIYNVKVSQNIVENMCNQTGDTVKGIFNLQESSRENIQQTSSIAELTNSSVAIGSKYYTKKVNGFIEFDAETELVNRKKFKDFNYTVVAGKYPILGESENLYQIAISTYLADSIMHYMNGELLNGKTVSTYTDFLGAQFTVDFQNYTVVGIIDCGKIPEKYAPLTQATYYNMETNALANDFNAFIDSSAQRCLFVADGFLQAVKQEKKIADVYQISNASWTLTSEKLSVAKKVTGYVYNTKDYDAENILLFSGHYPQNAKLTLADDEVLISPINLKDLFNGNMQTLSAQDSANVTALIDSLQNGNMQDNRNALQTILRTLNAIEPSVTVTITQRSSVTGQKQEKTVKIVGVYFGITSGEYAISSQYKLMMNTVLMKELGVYSEQGIYSKLLFSERSIKKGTDVIVESLSKQNGLALNLYNNSILNTILENETIIRQVADLFLYAAIALSVFSIFMLYNYISVSIASKTQSVGVLRALGAGGKDILCTFLSESLMVSVINGILANVLSVLGCNLVNSYIIEIMHISVHFALFGIRQILIITAISVLTAILASSLPIIKISKKKPIELIRRSS